MKYKRAKNQYRSVEERINDWDEIYNHNGVQKYIQVQAARLFEEVFHFLCKNNDQQAEEYTSLFNF